MRVIFNSVRHTLARIQLQPFNIQQNQHPRHTHTHTTRSHSLALSFYRSLSHNAAHYNRGHYHFTHKTRWASPLTIASIQFGCAISAYNNPKANIHNSNTSNDCDREENRGKVELMIRIGAPTFRTILTFVILFPSSIDILQTINPNVKLDCTKRNDTEWWAFTAITLVI